MKRPVRRQGMRVRPYPVLVAAVESGVRYGLARAHKYNDKPPRETIVDAIIQAVLNDICEAFDFDDEERS